MAEITTTSAKPRDLSAEEFARLLEQRTQRHPEIALDAFLAALDAGELPDSPAVMNLAILVGARSR